MSRLTTNRDIDWCLVTAKEAIPTVKKFVQKIGPIPIRTLFYNLLSREIIPNTRGAYNKLGNYIRDARKDGRIPWDSIIDETRHSIANFYDYYISPDDHIHRLLYQLGELHNDYVDKILYKWYKQPCYVEVWLEKNALVGTFKKFLEGRHVRIVPNRGYGSWTYAYENCKRLSKMQTELDYEDDSDGLMIRNDSVQKEIHILYFGDYDPSGVDMDIHMNEQIRYFIKYFHLENIHFERIAITRAQIKKFHLPSKPRDTKTLNKLDRDTRTDDFKEKHGGRLYAVELDALLAYQPDEFERLVQDTTDKYYKPDVFKELSERPEHSKEAIRCLVIKMVKLWLRDAEERIKK
jgi:hypothetical protein